MDARSCQKWQKTLNKSCQFWQMNIAQSNIQRQMDLLTHWQLLCPWVWLHVHSSLQIRLQLKVCRIWMHCRLHTSSNARHKLKECINWSMCSTTHTHTHKLQTRHTQHGRQTGHTQIHISMYTNHILRTCTYTYRHTHLSQLL